MQLSLKGSVSNQISPGEVVTITLTHPDGTPEAVTALTDENSQFAANVNEVPGTGYRAVAHIDADTEYQAADSPEVTFEVSKQERTLVLQVG